MFVSHGASTLGDWQAFFAAAAASAAALAGLIFVSVSVNLRSILAEENKIGSSYLTGRAAESVVTQLVVLSISVIGLTPHISAVALAAVLVAAAGICATSPVRSFRAWRSSGVKPIAFTLRLVLAVTLVAALLATGVTLYLGVGGGLLWFPFAFVLALIVAATNAWILLVEVLR